MSSLTEQEAGELHARLAKFMGWPEGIALSGAYPRDIGSEAPNGQYPYIFGTVVFHKGIGGVPVGELWQPTINLTQAMRLVDRFIELWGGRARVTITVSGHETTCDLVALTGMAVKGGRRRLQKNWRSVRQWMPMPGGSNEPAHPRTGTPQWAGVRAGHVQD